MVKFSCRTGQGTGQQYTVEVVPERIIRDVKEQRNYLLAYAADKESKIPEYHLYSLKRITEWRAKKSRGDRNSMGISIYENTSGIPAKHMDDRELAALVDKLWSRRNKVCPASHTAVRRHRTGRAPASLMDFCYNRDIMYMQNYINLYNAIDYTIQGINEDDGESDELKDYLLKAEDFGIYMGIHILPEAEWQNPGAYFKPSSIHDGKLFIDALKKRWLYQRRRTEFAAKNEKLIEMTDGQTEDVLEHRYAGILEKDGEGYMRPKLSRESEVPLPVTYHERAWLYFILENYDTSAFISDRTRDKLYEVLKDRESLTYYRDVYGEEEAPYPIKSSHFAMYDPDAKSVKSHKDGENVRRLPEMFVTVRNDIDDERELVLKDGRRIYAISIITDACRDDEGRYSVLGATKNGDSYTPVTAKLSLIERLDTENKRPTLGTEFVMARRTTEEAYDKAMENMEGNPEDIWDRWII